MASGAALVVLATQSSPVLALGALVAVCLFALLVRYPSVGLFITAAVIPLERMGRLTEDASAYTVSVMRVVGMLALAALVVHHLLNRLRFKVDLPLVLYAGYFGFAALTIAYTTDQSGTIRACGAILANLLFFFLVTNLTQTKRHADTAIMVWLAASVLAGIYTIYDWHIGSHDLASVDFGQVDPGRGEQETGYRFTTIWEDRAEWETTSSVRRAMGPTSHSAVYGINLILTLPFFAYLLRRARNGLARTLLTMGALIISYNLLLTNTRAAILVGIGVMALCVARGLLRPTIPQLAGAMVVGALLFFVIPSDIYARMLDLSSYTSDRSATLRIRLDYWAAGWRLIEDHWLTGVGVGNQNAVPEYAATIGPSRTTVHNEYIQTALEVGVGGWLLFIGFVGVLLWYGVAASTMFRQRRDTQEEYWLMVACQIAMVGVLVYGLTVDVFHFPLKGWWLVAAITAVMYRTGRQLSAPG